MNKSHQNDDGTVEWVRSDPAGIPVASVTVDKGLQTMTPNWEQLALIGQPQVRVFVDG